SSEPQALPRGRFAGDAAHVVERDARGGTVLPERQREDLLRPRAERSAHPQPPGLGARRGKPPGGGWARRRADPAGGRAPPPVPDRPPLPPRRRDGGEDPAAHGRRR